jgi:hypothetical protein
MAHGERQFEYSVVRDFTEPGYADVSLIRFPAPHGVLERLLHRERHDALVLAHRWMLCRDRETTTEWFAWRSTSAGLTDTGSGASSLPRDFDASQPDALVASTEFLTELQA